LNFSLRNISGAKRTESYFRFEPRVGYENDHFWIAITTDYRVVFKEWESSLFLKLDGGIKFSDKQGISIAATQRLIGEQFFETYISFGFYRIF
jgi:hypothetical protein